MDQKSEKDKGIVPVFEKKQITTVVYKEVRYHHILRNLLEKDKEIKVIGLIRNPMAVINSWLKAPKEFRPDLGWEVEKEWKNAPQKNQGREEEFNGFEKWKEVTMLYEELQKLYPERFYLLKYDDLLSKTLEGVRRLYRFLNLPLTNQTIMFIDKSRSTSVEDPYGVFKQKNNDNQWKGSLPSYIIEEIQNELSGTSLEKYLHP